jgi:soluble lytic murein transglycosylase-like protein
VSGEATPAIEEAVTVAVPVAVPADAWEPSEDVPLEPELQAYIYDACETYDVPMPLALALIEHESGFDPWVYSADGRNFGLMQINSINYGWLRGAGIEPTGYPGNIEAGVLMLGTLLDKYADPHKALVAYNGGEAGAKRLWDRGIYTSSFSRSVLAAAEQYERE